MEDLKALETLPSEKFVTRTSAECLLMLEAEGVPAVPVLSIAEMHADPYVAARRMTPETEHPIPGAVKTLGLPVTIRYEPFSK